jgi:uncharacterized protein YjbJ (UPF0337 family)
MSRLRWISRNSGVAGAETNGCGCFCLKLTEGPARSHDGARLDPRQFPRGGPPSPEHAALTGNVYPISPLARHTHPEGMMSSGTTDKIKGATNEAVGKAKRAVGKATGSAKLKREGDIQEAKGDAQTAMGKAKKTLKG